MTIFGLTITRTKALPQTLSSVPTRGLWSGGWYPLIREPFSGAWQKNLSLSMQDVLAFSTVWACITMISRDIAKVEPVLVERDANGIWTPTENSAYSPVLRKPNHYQTRVKFFEYWHLCRLIHGNTYVLKQRDNRGVVSALYILDPTLVKPLVSDDGFVYYQIGSDVLSGVTENSIVVPASEIIHDTYVTPFHPLLGVSPIFAAGLAATQGLKIQNNSTNLFTNGSQLGGILTAPGQISDETAKRLEDQWNTEYMGERNAGKVAVVGDGLKFEPMVMTATDAQLIDQLKFTELDVCKAFLMPPYMLGLGGPPPYTDIQSINLQYYNQTLQNPIENEELLLDEGLSLPSNIGIAVDVDNLARMDSKTQMEIAAAGVGAGIFAPNEERAKFSRKPKEGGDTPYLQQQNFSLAALAKRDAMGPTPVTAPVAAPMPTPAMDEPKQLDLHMIKSLSFALTHQRLAA